MTHIVPLPTDGEILSRASQLTRGRKFDADELRLMLLWLLAQAAGHGYALAGRLGELSHDYYRPSPGALYPALAHLEAQGLVDVQVTGKRKNYRISTSGETQLQEQAEQAGTLIAILRHAGKRMLWMRQAGRDEAAAAAATGWLPEYVQARRELKAALLLHDEAGPAEQRRIITILRHATDALARTHRDTRTGLPASPTSDA